MPQPLRHRQSDRGESRDEHSRQRPSRRGAALDQVIGASAAAMLATAALLYLGWAHRTGRRDLLRRVAAFAARDTGFEPWAALPSLIAAGALLIALVGMYWDISLHIDQGRDAGPLANPAHYLILAGLFGIFVAGFLAIVLPDRKPSDACDPDQRRLVRAARRRGDARRGGVRADRLPARRRLASDLRPGRDPLGPDPPDADRGRRPDPDRERDPDRRGARESVAPPPRRALRSPPVARHRRVYAAGGLLLGLSTFQAEFDFGVPQFQLVLEPIMLAFAAGVALVAARVWIGAGAALGGSALLRRRPRPARR